MATIVDIVTQAIAPSIQAPYELVDVEYVKEAGNWYLRAYIDKPGGITVDDCEVVNRELGDLLDRAADQLVHVELDRVSPLAVPVMVMIGREATPQGSVDDELLLEAESLAGAAMQVEDLPFDEG